MRFDPRGWGARAALLIHNDIPRRFHRDQRGDEGVNKILIIALVAIPLIILLIVFGSEIVQWFKDKWNDVGGRKNDINTNAP